MATKYIGVKTSRMYDTPTSGGWDTVTIFGDEVKTSGDEVNGRYKAEFRQGKGYIDKDHLTDEKVLEMYFIDVGQGDATFIVTPKRKKILIDGGVNYRALAFLAWKYRLDKQGAEVNIDLMVLSHADGDHIKGLIPILNHPRIKIHKIIHSGIATYKEGKYDSTLGDWLTEKDYLITKHNKISDLKKTFLSDEYSAFVKGVEKQNCTYEAVSSTTGTIDVGDPNINIEVIGPRLDKVNNKDVYDWLGGVAKTINGHSVILRMDYDQVSTLFSGDINKTGAICLMKDPTLIPKLNAHVFKAPHHGSHDYSQDFLEAVRPQISVISSGDDPDHGHPRAVLIGAVGRHSRSDEPLVFSTEIAATFVEEDVEVADETPIDLEEVDVETTEGNAVARTFFKRRLHGMINVRTDGKKMYAARRVRQGYRWESYGGIKPEV